MNIANVALGNVGVVPDWQRLRCWLERQRPDVVTLQKIGPRKPAVERDLRKIGYEGWFCHHRKNELGVAILADRRFLNRHDRSPKVLDRELPGDDPYERRFPNQARFLTVSIGNLWISSVYAPYGPEKVLRKWGAIRRRVAWLNRLRDHVRSKDHDRWLLCGDFNVKADGPPWNGNLYSQCEKDALEELGFCDLYRKAHPCVTESRGSRGGAARVTRRKAPGCTCCWRARAWRDVSSPRT